MLARYGIVTIDDLCRCTPDALFDMKNFGITSLREVEEALTKIGRRLANPIS